MPEKATITIEAEGKVRTLELDEATIDIKNETIDVTKSDDVYKRYIKGRKVVITITGDYGE